MLRWNGQADVFMCALAESTHLSFHLGIPHRHEHIKAEQRPCGGVFHTDHEFCILSHHNAFVSQVEGDFVRVAKEGIEQSTCEGHNASDSKPNEFNPSLRGTNNEAEEGC
jgi:hypothetical protein